MKQQYKIITALLILLSMSAFAQVQAPLEKADSILEETIIEETDVVVAEPVQEETVIEEVDSTPADEEKLQEETDKPAAKKITGDSIREENIVDITNLDLSENERKLFEAILPSLSQKEQEEVIATIKEVDEGNVLDVILAHAKEMLLVEERI